MAVLQMQRISICALKKDRKPILEALQRYGVVELSNLSSDDSFFQKTDTASQKSQFERTGTLAAQALEILDTYAPVKSSMLSMFEGRTALDDRAFQEQVQKRQETLHTANRLTALSKKIAENRAEIVKRHTQLDALEPWMQLDVSLRFSGTRYTAAFIGAFAEELTLDAIQERLAAHAPQTEAVSVDLVSVSRDQTCVFIVCLRRDAQAVEDALRAMGFIRPASPPKEPPAERRKMLLGYISEAEKSIEAAEKEIVSLSGVRGDLQFMIDDMAMRAEKYEMIGRLLQSRSTFLLSGYVPKAAAGAVEKELSGSYGAAVSIEEPAEDEDVPVVLKNSKFAEPVEGVLASFNLPTKGEIDPTSIMSVFYYVLFGLMFSDFAYGAIMAAACFIILQKYKNMDYGWRKTMRMFLFCGISTAVWGIIFGGYFGDVIDRVAVTFLGMPDSALPIIKPLWFAPLDDPMRMLAFSLLLGVIHLFTGLAIAGYQFLRAGKLYDFFAKVVCWYALVGGGIVYLLSTPMVANMMTLSEPIGEPAATIAKWAAIAGAVGIVLTNGSSKNPVLRFLLGLYELYNVTGYLSDILSYSRLLALGLATGVIGQVFNQIGSMGGSGPIGIILFIVVFAIGHAANFGINALGAYVHCNRLQYVEFFGKFYEGGGRAFEPFAAHTKYYKFKEDK